MKRRSLESNKNKNKNINKMKVKINSSPSSIHTKSIKIHYKQLINLANYLLKLDLTLVSYYQFQRRWINHGIESSRTKS